MAEETQTEKFERLLRKNNIMTVSRMYSKPSLEQLFSFFKDVVADVEAKKLTDFTPASDPGDFMTNKKVVLPTKRQPSPGVSLSKYKPKKRVVVKKSRELTQIDTNVLKLLKNRKVRGLSANELISLLELSSSAIYGALRNLKAHDLIELDSSGRVPKCWIIKGGK